MGVGTRSATFYDNFLKPLTRPDDAYLADLSLQALAIQTGGRLFGNQLIQTSRNNSVADLDAIYTLLIDAAPSEKPDTFHPLDIASTRPT